MAKKQAKKRKTGGRKRGTPNKTTVAVKQALTEAFDRWGGVPALVRFARKKPEAFLKLWAKMLPVEVKAEHTGPGGGPLKVQVYIPTNGRDPAAPAAEPGPGGG